MFCRKSKVLSAALLLSGLTTPALACGPASPSGQGAAAQAETPAPTIQPTATPYPPGYVKPTDLPTDTPWPTVPSAPPTPTPRPTDLPPPDLIVTPVVPVPTRDMTKRPIKIEYVPSSGVTVERMEAKTDAGSSTKPTTGNYLYLPKIGRYYSLPDDVKRVERIDLGTCIPETPCPAFPLLIYQRGEAFIGIDQVGETFEDVGNGDPSAFPFFTGEEGLPGS